MSANHFESLNIVPRGDYEKAVDQFGGKVWQHHRNMVRQGLTTLNYQNIYDTGGGKVPHMIAIKPRGQGRYSNNIEAELLIRVEALEKRNAELEEKCSGAQDMSAILNRLDILEKKNADLESANTILNEKLNTVLSLRTLKKYHGKDIWERVSRLESTAETLLFAGDGLEEKVTRLAFAADNGANNRAKLQVQIDSIRKGLSVHYSRDSVTDKRFQDIEEKMSENKELITDIGLLASNSGNQLVQFIEDVEELKNQQVLFERELANKIEEDEADFYENDVDDLNKGIAMSLELSASSNQYGWQHYTPLFSIP